MIQQNDPFSTRVNSGMEINGLKCTLNMPKVVERIKNADGSEGIANLPPYNPRAAFPVDEYPGCPENWMHGSGKASSYFVPILAEHGMWLDFNTNNQDSHDVAVVISIQGINPLTGLKVDPVRLEQYRTKCPKHNIDFSMNRYCSECKFEWHPQNYLSSNNGSPFWIDGFRTEDGVTRQWYFSEDECKGIAAQLIGKDRVFSIGIAFYRSKNPKPKPTFNYHSIASSVYSMPEIRYMKSLVNVNNVSTSCDSNSFGAIRSRISRGPSASSQSSPVKNLEIGAGAKINQKINPDPQNLDYWQDEPSGLLYINYCDVATAGIIIAGGKREKTPEGFLEGLQIKN